MRIFRRQQSECPLVIPLEAQQSFFTVCPGLTLKMLSLFKRRAILVLTQYLSTMQPKVSCKFVKMNPKPIFARRDGIANKKCVLILMLPHGVLGLHS